MAKRKSATKQISSGESGNRSHRRKKVKKSVTSKKSHKAGSDKKPVDLVDNNQGDDSNWPLKQPDEKIEGFQCEYINPLLDLYEVLAIAQLVDSLTVSNPSEDEEHRAKKKYPGYMNSSEKHFNHDWPPIRSNCNIWAICD